MIVGIRSAIICDEVERTDDGGANYRGIYGDPLIVTARPGFLHVWLAMQVITDRKITTGNLVVKAADFETVLPFDVPAGLRCVDLATILLIPVLAEGPLAVSVVDDRQRAKPFRVKWGIEFDPDAQVLDEAAGRKFVEAGKAAAAMMAEAHTPKTRKH